MKTNKVNFLFIITALLGASLSAQAKEQLISETTYPVEVELNQSTVKLSAIGYTRPELKVLIPALANITLMNHRNIGEGAPCVTAGIDHDVADILNDSNRLKEIIPVTIKLTKIQTVAGGQCVVSLQEDIKTTIRGIDFFHRRLSNLGNRIIKDCDL